MSKIGRFVCVVGIACTIALGLFGAKSFAAPNVVGACGFYVYSTTFNSARFVDRDGSVNNVVYEVTAYDDGCGHVYFTSYTQVEGSAWPQWMYSALQVYDNGQLVFNSYNFVGSNAPQFLSIQSGAYLSSHSFTVYDNCCQYGQNYAWNPAWSPAEPQTNMLKLTYP